MHGHVVVAVPCFWGCVLHWCVTLINLYHTTCGAVKCTDTFARTALLLGYVQNSNACAAVPIMCMQHLCCPQGLRVTRMCARCTARHKGNVAGKVQACGVSEHVLEEELYMCVHGWCRGTRRPCMPRVKSFET